MSTATAPTTVQEKRPWAWLAAPLLVFAFVSLIAGFLARAADPGGAYFELFFSDTIHMKAWLATAAATLGLSSACAAFPRRCCPSRAASSSRS